MQPHRLNEATHSHTCALHTHSYESVIRKCFIFMLAEKYIHSHKYTHAQTKHSLSRLVVSLQRMPSTYSHLYLLVYDLTFDSRSLYMTHWWCVIYRNGINTIIFVIQKDSKNFIVFSVWNYFLLHLANVNGFLCKLNVVW